jgi:RNA recognition motif-containing protein
MHTTIYVANLPKTVSESDIETLFSPFGAIHSIKLITDKDSGEPAGYGFVEMDAAAANNAIYELNGADFQGQMLQVNQARGRQTDR